MKRVVSPGFVAIVAATALLGACSSSAGTHPDGSAGTTGAGGEQGSYYGNVLVDVNKSESAYTDFQAQFRDGPLPPASDKGPTKVSQTQGGCQLIVPAGCPASCPTGTVCYTPTQCNAVPGQLSAGTLHVHGLGTTDLDLEPTSAASPVYMVVPTLGYPVCDEGAAVTITATDFTLAGKCVSGLVVTSQIPIPVMAGGPVALAWTAPGAAAASRMLIELEISHHGGYKGEIDCDVPDTGSFSIPEPLVTALVNLGRAGYPTIKLRRSVIATTPTQSHVQLIVQSEVERAVDTGVISCMGDQDCPTGKTCDMSTRTCT